MNDSKTLVDQLRHMVASTSGVLDYPTCSEACKEIFGRTCGGAYDEREIFNTIADRIEREYLPRPILEGEPLKIGDKVDGYNQNGAEVVAIMNSNMIVVRSTVKGGNGYHDEAYPLLLWSVDELKRPEPEVLDADGVPIHVGDTVWRTDEINGNSRIVKDFYKDGSVVTDYKGKIPVCVNPKHLTHKEPDSLERIEADVDKIYIEYWGCKMVNCWNCPSRIDGKTPDKHYGVHNCARAMYRDILRRQREVLERGQE